MQRRADSVSDVSRVRTKTACHYDCTAVVYRTITVMFVHFQNSVETRTGPMTCSEHETWLNGVVVTRR